MTQGPNFLEGVHQPVEERKPLKSGRFRKLNNSERDQMIQVTLEFPFYGHHQQAFEFIHRLEKRLKVEVHAQVKVISAEVSMPDLFTPLEAPAVVNNHLCRHPRCRLPVPPRLAACNPHWKQLPKPIRDRIWRAYRPGQETDKTPSSEYLAAMDQATGWWEAHD